ncbi:MAG TPA: hypothetical protein VLM87_09810 [Rubrivivax sp.]|nr:hypothetical protein [Rubrivivax sp.]
MSNIVPLMQREWLQHRFGWSLMAVVPIGLALLLVAFGEVQLDPGEAEAAGDALPAMLAAASIGAGTVLIFLIAWLSSAILVSGLSRRDHADRSVEFWLSLPVGHSRFLATPLFVHLLLVPAAALLVGLVGGTLVSMVLVGRVAGMGAWFALPWATLVPAALAAVGRLLLGLPLATLWLLPLIMLVVLFTAWFRRWGLIIVGVGAGLGSYLLELVFGQPLLWQAVVDLIRNAALSMAGASQTGPTLQDPENALAVLGALPGWVLNDFGHALALLASPLLAGGLLVAAACFALLVDWRRRGAQAAG